MNPEILKTRLASLDLVSRWSEMMSIFDSTVARSGQLWKLPVLACEAVDGDPILLPAIATAIACLQTALVLVDDILDEDPRGVYHQLGYGVTANLAQAFQISAFHVIIDTPMGDVLGSKIIAELASSGLATSFGQQLDHKNQGNEIDYWQVVRAKNAPLFGSALCMGAMLGETNTAEISRMRQFGALLGELSQIYDDIKDAFQMPANPDWAHPRNNLLVLYALSAQYSDRSLFANLLNSIEDPPNLRKAQQFLITSGAVAYAVYHASKRSQEARNLIDSLSIKNPEILSALLDKQESTLRSLYKLIGVDFN
jgi:geranylgeranyl pyrophosphate synthase